MPSRDSGSSSSSSGRATVFPSYVVNDKGFLTVRPAALQDSHPGLAARAAEAAALLLAAYAPDRLLGGASAGTAGGATYALSMMVHSTNVLWWHLGPYDECSRSQRMWVVVSGKASSPGGIAKLKLPGGDHTVPLAELGPGLEEVAWELHALMGQVVRSSQHPQEQATPAGVMGLAGGGGASIENVLNAIRNIRSPGISINSSASTSASISSDRSGATSAAAASASAPPDAGALPRPSPALMVGGSGSSTAGSSRSTTSRSSAAGSVMSSFSLVSLPDSKSGSSSTATPSSGNGNGNGSSSSSRMEALEAKVDALTAAVEQLALLMLVGQQHTAKQPLAPATPPQPSNADRRERWR